MFVVYIGYFLHVSCASICCFFVYRVASQPFAVMLMSAIFWIFILPSSLIAAVWLYDLYRRQKKQLEDVEGDLALVCQLAKAFK